MIKLDTKKIPLYYYGKSIEEMCKQLSQLFYEAAPVGTDVVSVSIEAVQDEYSDTYSPNLVINYNREETPAEAKERLRAEKNRNQWEHKHYLALKKKFEK
jgi:hypothetical protein